MAGEMTPPRSESSTTVIPLRPTIARSQNPENASLDSIPLRIATRERKNAIIVGAASCQSCMAGGLARCPVAAGTGSGLNLGA
jgi:hypothetical protein